jgi:hypothetical protein
MDTVWAARAHHDASMRTAPFLVVLIYNPISGHQFIYGEMEGGQRL